MRHEFFIEHLCKQHEIHLVEWDTFGRRGMSEILSPFTYIRASKYWETRTDKVMIHHIPRLYDPTRRIVSEKSETLRINERLFQRQIREIVRKQYIDVMICGPSSYLVGFPPFDMGIPTVFDYLDCTGWDTESMWKSAEITYIRNSTAVLAVSSIAYRQAKLHNKNTYRLPNGVDVARFRNADGKAVRDELGLVDKKVISLIGISCCPSLYFIDAVGRLAAQRRDVRCLVVGESILMPKIRAMAAKYGGTFSLTGSVGYRQIPEYFAATDVGLYPQNHHPYNQARSPIKIFEYVASGKWVVVSPCLRDVKAFGFPNPVFCEPNPIALRDTLESYIDQESPGMPESVREFDWELLSAKLEEILGNLL